MISKRCFLSFAFVVLHSSRISIFALISVCGFSTEKETIASLQHLRKEWSCFTNFIPEYLVPLYILNTNYHYNRDQYMRPDLEERGGLQTPASHFPPLLQSRQGGRGWLKRCSGPMTLGIVRLTGLEAVGTGTYNQYYIVKIFLNLKTIHITRLCSLLFFVYY